ncbi:unnamed protein product, partial [Polarella glacialis]
MAEGGKEAMDCSFDSKEDYDLYRRLMNEKLRIQKQSEERKKQTKAVKVRQVQASKLEERERGFEVLFSGANQERIEEARRRQIPALGAQERRPTGSSSGGHMRPPSADRGRNQWAVETVELRGK